MKIDIITTEKVVEGIEDINEIILKFNEVEEFFLLRDDKTEFKKFDKSEIDDIKKIFLFFTYKDEFIGLKGSLSLKEHKSFKVEFFPIFKDKFSLQKLGSKYLYNVKKEISENLIKQISINHNAYKEILSDLKDEKWIHPKDSNHWKDFIEPYEYFIKLKEMLLKKDFESFSGFEGKIEEVIKVDSNSDFYNNFLDKPESIIDSYDDNRNSFLYIKYNNVSNFKNDFLENNKYYFSYSRKFFDKNQKQKAENEIRAFNSKFERKKSKLSFFQTNNFIDKNDFDLNKIKNNSLSKNDIELEVEDFIASDIEVMNETILFRYSEIFNLYKGIELKDTNINNLSELNDLRTNISNNINNYKKIKDNFINVSNDIGKNIKNIDDEDIEYSKNILEKIHTFLEKEIFIDDLKYFDSIIKELEDFKFLKVNEIENKIKNLSSNLKGYFDKEVEVYNVKINEYNGLINELRNKNDLDETNKNLLKKYKKNIREIKEKKLILERNIKNENDLKIKKLETELSKDLLIEESNWINNKISSIIYSKEESIEILEKLLTPILNLIKNKTIRTVSYFYDVKIYFNFQKNKDSYKEKMEIENLSNIYVINTGDFVLIDTINQIIKKVKHQDGKGDEILSKIIGKTNFIEFDENENSDEDILKILPSFKKLNISQQEAFKNAISITDPISIIQGPPGTGKTETITQLIKYYRNKGEKVIVSSQTNVAIKNVLSKLTSNDKIEDSIISIWLTSNESKEEYSFTNINKTWYKKIFSNLESLNGEWDDIKNKIKIERDNNLRNDSNVLLDVSQSNEVMVFGATTTTSKTLHGRVDSRYISDAKVLIIDEVSKSILPEILRYALDVKKVILVGDYKQLNPIFDISEDDFDEGEIDRYKFKKLRKEIQSGVFYELSKRAEKYKRIKTLKINYRSLPGVLDAYNIFYADEGSLEPYRRFEEFNQLYEFKDSKYFENNKNFYFFNVRGSKEEKRGTSRYNRGEISKIFDVLDDLLNSLGEKSKEKDLAIIFPYAAQISLFTNEVRRNDKLKRYRKLFKTIKWDTVDSFQGSEANIVVLSTVVTKDSNSTFLSDFRRINVSLSRAKDMLLIFGNKTILENIEIRGEGIETKKYFREIFDIKKNNHLKIIEVKVGEE